MKNLSTLILMMTITLAATAQKSEVYCTSAGAIKGYDVVAFFTQNKPVMGSKSLTYIWNNAEWHFATEENKKAFIDSPAKYAPQYGGYCAYGTAEGHKAPTLTETWTIVDGKLYFNYNADVKKLWIKNQHELIGKADEMWPTIKGSD